MEPDTKMERQLAFNGWLAEDDRAIDSDDEYTPPELCDRIRDFFGGDIDLDPCSAPGSFVNARVQYFKGDDGLRSPWNIGPDSGGCSGLVIRTRYVNPPYSKPGPWLKRIVEIHQTWPADEPGQTIALVKCDPSTKAWAYAWQADAILFFARRIPFVKPGRQTRASAKFPCALLYWGAATTAFSQQFADLGRVLIGAPDDAVEAVVARLESQGFVRKIEAYGETRYTLSESERDTVFGPPSRDPKGRQP